MTHAKLHRLALSSTFALSIPACLLDPGTLEAGADSAETSGDADESCLVGTELDAIGIDPSSSTPPCEVTCDDGWGHSGGSLAIEWTTSVIPEPGDQPLLPAGLAALPGGGAVVAAISLAGLELVGFDAAGGTTWTTNPIQVAGQVHHLALASNAEGVYVIHSIQAGNLPVIGLSAFEFDGSHRWTIELEAEAFAGVAASSAGVAILLTPTLAQATRELAMFDSTGALLWSTPAEQGMTLSFSGSGDRLAIGDRGVVSIRSTLDGAPIDELQPSLNGAQLGTSALAFSDEDTVVTVGAVLAFDATSADRFDGWIERRALDLSGWTQTYNRATSWCPDPGDTGFEAATAEFFNDVVALPGGGLLVVGSENFDGQGTIGGQPWVGRVASDGTMIASDRGMWDGFALGVVAHPDDTALVLSTARTDPNTIVGFHLRKYSL